MIRVIALILLAAIVWKGIPFFTARLLWARRSHHVVRPLNDREDHSDV
jgi:hypothetical protein